MTENTPPDYFSLYREGRVEGLKSVALQGPASALAVPYDSWEADFRVYPPPLQSPGCPHL